MRLRKKLTVAVTVFFLVMSTGSAFALNDNTVFGDSGTDMAVDLVVARPAGIAATAVGCVFFAAALPFTVWSKKRISKAGRSLVVNPGKYAFVRPLGDFQTTD